MRDITSTLAILAFGAIALVGLIVLAGIGHLDAATRGILQAVIVGALTAAGVTVTPGRGQPAITDPAAPRARRTTG